MRVARFVKQHVEIAVVSEEKLRENTVRILLEEKNVMPLSPHTSRCSVSFKKSKITKKTRRRTNPLLNIFQSLYHASSFTQAVLPITTKNSYDEESRGVQVLKLLNTYLTTVFDFDDYSLHEQSQEQNSYIFGERKRAKRAELRMNSTLFKSSDATWVFLVLKNCKTA